MNKETKIRNIKEKEIVNNRKRNLKNYYNNIEKKGNYNCEWQKKNPEKCREIANRQYKKHREKILLRSKGTYHTKIPKGQVCQFKGCRKLAKERHHEDYDKPLVVKFYCIKHHHFIHRRIKIYNEAGV